MRFFKRITIICACPLMLKADQGAQALPDSPVRPIFISLGLTTVEILRSGITPLRKIVAVHIG